MNTIPEIPEIEFYIWIERFEELVSILEEHYLLSETDALQVKLDEHNGLFHPSTEKELDPHFVTLTVMSAEPEGVYLGETWGDVSSEEAWQRIFQFQQICERTCVAVTGVGLPPKCVDDFLRMASNSLKGLF